MSVKKMNKLPEEERRELLGEIEKLRKEMDMSVIEFAAFLGVHTSTYRLWLDGSSLPKLPTISLCKLILSCITLLKRHKARSQQLSEDQSDVGFLKQGGIDLLVAQLDRLESPQKAAISRRSKAKATKCS